MKKVLFIMVLIMAVLVVNVQTAATIIQAKPATIQEKPTTTVVKIADLPKAITDNIAKDYAGFTIKEATSTIQITYLPIALLLLKGPQLIHLFMTKMENLLK